MGTARQGGKPVRKRWFCGTQIKGRTPDKGRKVSRMRQQTVRSEAGARGWLHQRMTAPDHRATYRSWGQGPISLREHSRDLILRNARTASCFLSLNFVGFFFFLSFKIALWRVDWSQENNHGRQ